MLLPPEAFVHVPMLSGKIVEPEQSFFRTSRAKFEEWDQIARDNGYAENWRRARTRSARQPEAGRSPGVSAGTCGCLPMAH